MTMIMLSMLGNHRAKNPPIIPLMDISQHVQWVEEGKQEENNDEHKNNPKAVFSAW
jgi:hypothetical protein